MADDLQSEHALLVAKSFDDLRQLLKQINVEVPPRGMRRTSHHVEIYAVVRLLGTLPRVPADFPFRLRKTERPDFVIEFPSRTIGVEHTEAISQNDAKAAALRSLGHGKKFHFLRQASLDEPPKSSKTLIGEINADVPGPGWMGDSVEREWAAAMAHFVREKILSAQRPGYQLFAHNWLLIYDNWSAPGLDREKGVEFLLDGILPTATWDVFDRVFILDENVLLELSPESPIFYQVNHCQPADDEHFEAADDVL